MWLVLFKSIHSQKAGRSSNERIAHASRFSANDHVNKTDTHIRECAADFIGSPLLPCSPMAGVTMARVPSARMGHVSPPRGKAAGPEPCSLPPSEPLTPLCYGLPGKEDRESRNRRVLVLTKAALFHCPTLQKQKGECIRLPRCHTRYQSSFADVSHVILRLLWIAACGNTASAYMWPEASISPWLGYPHHRGVSFFMLQSIAASCCVNRGQRERRIRHRSCCATSNFRSIWGRELRRYLPPGFDQCPAPSYGFPCLFSPEL
jgi:hypothetical protein